MEGGGDENVFKREFDRLDAGNGVVLIRDMPRLIEGALGRDTRPWIKDRILKMFETNRDGKISWLDLQDGLRKAVGATRSDVSYRERQVPEWLVFNRKVRQKKKNFLGEYYGITVSHYIKLLKSF